MPYLAVCGCVSGAEQSIKGVPGGYELARRRAMRLLVEKLRPYIEVTNLPRTGDDYKVKVEMRTEK